MMDKNVYISKNELVSLLYKNYGDTGYIDVSLDEVLELVDTLPTTTINESDN